MNIDFLLNTPLERWNERGLTTSAASTNSDGMVNSFLGRFQGRRIYGHRKHEFRDGAFTGKESFVVEAA